MAKNYFAVDYKRDFAANNSEKMLIHKKTF
jgi:hypothetical protein